MFANASLRSPLVEGGPGDFNSWQRSTRELIVGRPAAPGPVGHQPAPPAVVLLDVDRMLEGGGGASS
ncbi:hypothetical protein I6E56_07715 [Salinibacterium sp. NK8237]|nr:hypothetical protein [Salinibacterium sp. NK8237]